MSKFNKLFARSAGTSPVTSATGPTGRTHEGAPGYARDAKSELFLLAVANMVGEDTFYENADDRDSRYTRLVAQVAVADPGWTGRFLRWLRTGANMRSAALVGALEAARAMVAAGVPGSRGVVAGVLQRADEPGEALAYWTSRYGRAVPKPVKRGIADSLNRLYTEYALLKYDTVSKGFRFGDVVDLVHPGADAPWRGELFRHALDRRHGRDTDLPEALGMLRANAALRAAAARDPAVLLDADALRAAGFTWEDALSLAGSTVDKAKLWEALIPGMGLMALSRNLRNFDDAGVSDAVAETVTARFADPEQVRRSRMFPFRWLAAYRNAPSLRWAYALDRALTASLASVPALAGRTLVLVDVSGSMGGSLSARSQLNRADAAKAFGSALALRAADATLVWFDHDSATVPVPRGGSLLKLVETIPGPRGGTDTASAVTKWYDKHDRVVIVTDEQAGHGGEPTREVPAHVPVYTWNLAGYRYGHGPSGTANRHTFGGLTDQAFGMIPLVEAGQRADWPF